MRAYPMRMPDELYVGLQAEAEGEHINLADHIRRILYRRNDRGKEQGHDDRADQG